MAKNTNHPSSNLVNESTRELMSRRLPFVLRWGNILLLLLLLVIAGLALLIRYPAEVQGMLVVSQGKPVVVLYSPNEGVKAGQSIYTEGKLLDAVTSSQAYRNAEGLYQVEVNVNETQLSKKQVTIRTGSISLLRKVFR